MKVLIVDDRSEDRQLLRYMVERYGHQALEAGDGLEGLKKAKSELPDVIISDALMPVMDGFQFLREVKQDPALLLVPFIFYSSSYKKYQDVRLAMSLGADAYFIKPVEPAELWGKIEDIIRKEKQETLPSRLVEEDAEYLKRYSEVVVTKLEEKVRELERTLKERERAEEALRDREDFIVSILESVDEGFIVIDRDFRIQSANPAFIRLFSKNGSDIIGRHCYEVSHHVDRPCHELGEDCASRKTFATGESHHAMHKHINAEGKSIYVETKAYPMKDKAGKVVSVIEIVVDVTEKIKLEEQLRHAQKLEALGTLAGGVAHDFNNILTVIVGYGSMMKIKTPPDDPNLHYIREILAVSERAIQLTQSLLIFGRKQITELKPLDINELVKSMQKMVLRIIGEDIETNIDLAPERLAVMGDYGQLEQVLMNFATNARDAMPEGGSLSIETKLQEIGPEFIQLHGFGKPGKFALIAVSDTGKGMDEKTRERIFEPFFTTKSPGKGTGLGLSIVYGTVQQHNGYVSCYSEPDKGTTFTVYLPIIGESLRAVEEKAEETLKGGTETILVADDDENIRILLKELLESYGYDVIEAKDGEDAVKIYLENKKKIDLVLLDAIMPKKSGKEAFKEIREIQPAIKGLFISGYAGEVIQPGKIPEDKLPVLRKPIKLRDLLSNIREMLDNKE